MERRWWPAAGRVLLSSTCGIFLGVVGLVAGAVVGGYIAEATEPAIRGGAHESFFEAIGLVIRAICQAIVGGFVGTIVGAVLGTLGGAWLGQKAVCSDGPGEAAGPGTAEPDARSEGDADAARGPDPDLRF